MKHFIFRRHSNNFDDITKDPMIKKYIREKIKWPEHLFLGIEEENGEVLSYLMLKFGDDLLQNVAVCKDRTPIMYKDYYPVGLTNKEILKKKSSTP